jgi:hypothetical protein
MLVLLLTGCESLTNNRSPYSAIVGVRGLPLCNNLEGPIRAVTTSVARHGESLIANGSGEVIVSSQELATAYMAGCNPQKKTP